MAFEGGDGGNGGGADDAAAGLLGGALGGDAGAGGGAAGGGDSEAGAGGGAGEGEGGGSAAPDWFEKLSTDTPEGHSSSNRDWATSKGVKDLDGLVKMARDTERALRENGRIKVPGDGAKPEDVAAFRTAIGVPEKVDGYEVKAPDGVKLNEPLINAMRGSALKHGAPKGAFEGLIGDFIQAQMDEAHAETQRQDQLAKDWVAKQGGEKDAKIAAVTSAMRSLGLSSADGQALRGALGADRALDLMAKLGAGMAEDTMLTGGKGRFGISGAEAQAELDKLKGDTEFAKKNVPGSAERQRWDRLNAAAAQAKAVEAAG